MGREARDFPRRWWDQVGDTQEALCGGVGRFPGMVSIREVGIGLGHSPIHISSAGHSIALNSTEMI